MTHTLQLHHGIINKVVSMLRCYTLGFFSQNASFAIDNRAGDHCHNTESV